MKNTFQGKSSFIWLHDSFQPTCLAVLAFLRLYESHVRKIVKVQAIIRVVLAKLKKKRGDNFGRSHRGRSSRSVTSMSKDEAAVAIQKSELKI